jgi:hypothetical protein
MASEIFQTVLKECHEREKVVTANFMGLNMKCRIDAAGHWEGRRIILDLKKTQDGSPRGWGKKANQFHYDMQTVLYAHLLGLSEGLEQPPMVVHAVVEDSDAAPVSLYSVPQDMWTSGDEKLRRAVRLLQACLKTDTWPGYGDETIIAPIWRTYNENQPTE